MLLHRHFEDNAMLPPPEKPPVVPVEPMAERAILRKKPKGYRAAVYAGTRNLYYDMTIAAKSLLCTTNVDKIFLLVEDDVFPHELPKEIECVNVTPQTFFRPGGPNFHNHWTWMVLLRAALSKVFPDLHRILSLDVDTIVTDDLTDLWDLDMGDCYFAAVQENHANYRPYGPKYFNAGVMLQDLDAFRKNRIDDEIIAALNAQKFQYNEQCALNLFCKDHIHELPPRYNDGYICGITDDPAIVHYIGKIRWQTDKENPQYWRLEHYRAMSWGEVKKIRKEKFGR